jgi:hypothetical protein
MCVCAKWWFLNSSFLLQLSFLILLRFFLVPSSDVLIVVSTHIYLFSVLKSVKLINLCSKFPNLTRAISFNCLLGHCDMSLSFSELLLSILWKMYRKYRKTAFCRSYPYPDLREPIFLWVWISSCEKRVSESPHSMRTANCYRGIFASWSFQWRAVQCEFHKSWAITNVSNSKFILLFFSNHFILLYVNFFFLTWKLLIPNNITINSHCLNLW